MRTQLLKTVTAALFGVGVLVGAKTALANTHGVVFIHGTGDYPGTMTCSGAKGSANCVVSAALSGYWTSGEITSVSNGRPYAVVGFSGGSCAPWPQAAGDGFAADGTYGHTSTGSACPLATGTGNADVIAGQIEQFITANALTELVIVTHSGGSNQARYILQNYTRNSNFTAIKSITKRVITLAGCAEGTYLANEVFGGTITSLIGGLVGFGGEGVNLLRTNYMSTYNSGSSYFTNRSNPINGVNLYASGGTSKSACYGVTLWGACIGVTAQSLGTSATGGISCGSLVDDVGLLALHDLYLDANDSSTFRNGCSDGFISCQGSQSLGNTFAYNGGQDHNQSRQQCDNLDVNVRTMVNGAATGFDYGGSSAQINPHQLDACGFGVYAEVVGSNNKPIAYTEGCNLSQLGNGNCDWDCVALYGNDAVVTQWDSTGTKPLAWGASDCTATTNSYSGVTYTDTSTDPFAESSTYTTASGTFNTAFNGDTCTGTSAQCGGYASTTEWFYDPNYKSTGASTLGVGYCPQSWIGDGTCDECVLALYGADGNDCAPGHIVQCGGIVTDAVPYVPAGDGVVLCETSSQCPGMLGCNTSTGFCSACTNNTNNAAGSCNSTTYGWSGLTCNTSTGACSSTANTYLFTGNPIYNEGTPSNGGDSWLEWQSEPAVAGDNVCENTECTQGTLSAAPTVAGTSSAGTPCTNSNQCPGELSCNTTSGYCYACTSSANNANGSCNSTTYGWSGNGNCYIASSLNGGAACNTTADCLSGTCANGGCTTNSNDCSATWAVQARVCATNADCTGNSCQAATSTCLITGGACTTDASCPTSGTDMNGNAWSATSTCGSGGTCGCTTSNDCSGGAACNSGTCAATVTQSLCR